jgi:hypothetical protein
VLPTGVLRGVAEAVRRPRALLRSGAIVLGLSATVAGFAVGRMSLPSRMSVVGRRCDRRPDEQ